MLAKVRFSSVFFMALLLCTGHGLVAQSPSPAGTWTLRLGERTLMVLTLAPSSQKGFAFSGSLAGPKDWTSGDGSTFTRVQSGTISKPVVASEQRGDSLFFSVQTRENAADKESFLLHVVDAGHAELHPAEMPTFTMQLARADKPAVVSTDWDLQKSYSTEDGLPSNPEMKRIADEDQAARKAGPKIDWQKVGPEDAQRRVATAKLLNEGGLHTAEDFSEAAFVFQHGDKPDDYLLAHTLAMIAIKKGDIGAIWIGTATLDRYLQSIGQQQVYGTQFKTPDKAPATQDPYNRTLISDALRKQLNVPLMSAQEEQRKQYDKDRGYSNAPQAAQKPVTP